MVSIEMLIDSLNSNNDNVVLSALTFLKDEDKSALISPLILFHPSEIVVLTALDIFTESPRPMLRNIALRLLHEESESIRVGALRLLIQLDPPEQFLHAISQSQDLPLKTTAMTRLAIGRDINLSEIDALALDLQEKNDTAGLINLCRSLALWPEPALMPVYLQIYNASDSLDIQKAVLKAMRNIDDTASLDVAVKAYSEPELALHAEALILKCGTEGFDRLQTMLHSSECAYRTRIAIPGTMSRFDLPDISERLLHQFSYKLEGAISFKVLRALGRTGITASNETEKNRQLMQLDKLIEAELERLVQYTSAVRVMNDQVVAVNSSIFEMLFQLVADRTQESLERLFRIFNLRYEEDQYEQIFLDLQSDDEREHANAEELLLHAIPKSQAAPAIDAIKLLGKLSDLNTKSQTQVDYFLDTGEENKQLAAMMRRELGMFKALLNDESATVSALTAYLAGIAKLNEFSEDIRHQLSWRPSDTLECFDTASSMLNSDDDLATPDEVK